MLTTVNFSDRRTDGGHGPFFDLKMPTVPQWTKEAEERVFELLMADTSVGAVLDICAAEGLEMRREWVGRIAAKREFELRRGPKPGHGGRPLKGDAPRRRHSVGFEPRLMEWIERHRQEGESFADAVNRLLSQQMDRENK